jgi:hypothetical protein
MTPAIQPCQPGLADAVRAGAAGLYSLEAACELVISTGWLRRDDFTRFIRTGTCCPALKIPILAAFTMPMENRTFQALSWGRCRLRRPGAGVMAC